MSEKLRIDQLEPGVIYEVVGTKSKCGNGLSWIGCKVKLEPINFKEMKKKEIATLCNNCLITSVDGEFYTVRCVAKSPMGYPVVGINFTRGTVNRFIEVPADGTSID
jgi:hypothetical protein